MNDESDPSWGLWLRNSEAVGSTWSMEGPSIHRFSFPFFRRFWNTKLFYSFYSERMVSILYTRYNSMTFWQQMEKKKGGL